MVRCATDADRADILGVCESAFGHEEGPEIVELVTALLADETAMPRLSLVAEADRRIVGHVLFSAVQIPSSPRCVPAQILAPLAVSHDQQGEGVGGSLINAGLKQLASSGVALVFVLGHPDYYPKFGFRPAGVLGLEAPYPIPTEHADAWMVQELEAGVIGSVQGRVQCALSLDQARLWQA
ncbi:MAG: GNAT family N-acetyltransferase [Planctomycetota bacterium]|nr:MAG: GNAT family N-acetyltransferase [Planctomycetota bacterium]